MEVGKLSDVLPDDQNTNAHPLRGASTLEKSIRQRGFFRPTAAFGKGVDKPVMGAGNLTQETALNIGMDDAIFVYTDGTKPIVHVRTDVAPGSREAKLLSVEDNRSAELSLSWDAEALAGMDIDLSGLFDADEIDEIAAMADTRLSDAVPSGDRVLGDVKKQIKPVLYADEVATFERALRATGERNRGQALLTVCRAYLEQHEPTARQFDFALESQLTL